MVERFYVATKYFILRQSVAKVKRFCVAMGKLCCDMVSQAEKIYIAIEYFMSRQNWTR